MKLDYRVYHFTKREAVRYAGEASALCLLVNLLCYRSWWALAMFFVVPPLYFRHKKKYLIERRKKRLNYAFKDALASLSVALKAGYSMENAIAECIRDLRNIYEEHDPILQEFLYLQSQLSVSVPIEQLLSDFGNRCDVEDIRNFAGVYGIAKRSGGNLSRILQDAARTLNDRIEVQKEVEACVAAKKMEQTIMSVVPCGIILYIQAMSPGFLDVLYGSAAGVCVMTACLAGYAAAFWMGRKIVRIEV